MYMSKQATRNQIEAFRLLKYVNKYDYIALNILHIQCNYYRKTQLKINNLGTTN